MKIIFLDIDGVLNSDRSVLASSGHCLSRLNLDALDPIALSILRRLLKKSGAKIVFSTSHRNDPVIADNFAATFAKATDLEAYIWPGSNGLSHITPTILENVKKRRGEEIQKWIDAYEKSAGEELIYLIFDDSGGMLESQHRNFILVDAAVGLSASNYYEACKVLGVVESTILTFGD